MNLAPYLSGIALGASLIVAIGAQNALVLRQGLHREHVFAVASVCVAIDWVLIAVGAISFGSLIERFPLLTPIASWGGAVFLIVYGALSFRAATHPGKLKTEGSSTDHGGKRLGTVIGATLAVSLLNPHVYLDTVVLLGSLSAQYPAEQRVLFVAGAYTASALWFFGLAYGARLLAPLFAKPVAWRVLDIAIGVIMWWIAASLIWGQLG